MPMKNKWNMARKFSQLSHKFNLSEDVAVCCSMAKFTLAFASMPGLSSMSTRQFAWMSPSKWPHAWWLDNAPPLSFLRNFIQMSGAGAKKIQIMLELKNQTYSNDKSVLAGAPPAFGAAPPATGAANTAANVADHWVWGILANHIWWMDPQLLKQMLFKRSPVKNTTSLGSTKVLEFAYSKPYASWYFCRSMMRHSTIKSGFPIPLIFSLLLCIFLLFLPNLWDVYVTS